MIYSFFFHEVVCVNGETLRWKYFKNEQTLLKENQHKSENN
jgi:hypothetical protein